MTQHYKERIAEDLLRESCCSRCWQKHRRLRLESSLEGGASIQSHHDHCGDTGEMYHPVENTSSN